MKHNEAVKQYLTSLGWTYKGFCNCSGLPTHNYILGEYKIKIRQSNFIIKRPNQQSVKHPIGFLKQTLDEINTSIKATIQEETKVQSIPK